MNRLTGRDGDHAYALKCFAGGGCPDMDTSKCDFCDHHIAVYDLLAAYEDTGLTPNDITQIIALVQEIEAIHSKNHHTFHHTKCHISKTLFCVIGFSDGDTKNTGFLA